jgi:hypothetical protein
LASTTSLPLSRICSSHWLLFQFLLSYSVYMQFLHIFSQTFYYLSISLAMYDEAITVGMSTAGSTGCLKGCWHAFSAINGSCWRCQQNRYCDLKFPLLYVFMFTTWSWRLSRYSDCPSNGISLCARCNTPVQTGPWNKQN